MEAMCEVTIKIGDTVRIIGDDPNQFVTVENIVPSLDGAGPVAVFVEGGVWPCSHLAVVKSAR